MKCDETKHRLREKANKEITEETWYATVEMTKYIKDQQNNPRSFVEIKCREKITQTT